MKRKHLLRKLADFFDLEQRKQESHREKLRDILKQLRAKEKKLALKIEVERDPTKRDRLQNELSVVHAQRTKGIKTLKSLQPED